MKYFTIGPGLKCNLERLVETRLLVQANSGGGKSWLLRRILEQTAGKIQQLVIDPEGEFSTLRERYDFVLASKAGGDTAADPRTAALLAEKLLEIGVSAILDIYELDPHARILFVRRFLEALVDAPKSLWHPVLVVVDEAHTYCPEVGNAESASAVKALATRGRKRGFCAVFATQRLSKFAKDAAAECNNKLIGRTSLDVDMKRAGDELGLVKGDLQQLRELPPGTFFAYGPALSTSGIVTVQVGDVETSHPKVGGRLALAAPPPTSKVKALLPQLSDLPKESADRERTIAELKSELAQTKRELTLRNKTLDEVDAKTKRIDETLAKVKTVERFVLKDGQLARLEKIYERMLAKADDYGTAMALLWDQQSQEAKALLNVLSMITTGAALPKADVIPIRDTHGTTRQRVDRQVPVRPHERRVPPTPGTRRPPLVVSDNGEQLSGPERKILGALAELVALGLHPAQKQQLAIMAGYTNVRSGGFSEPLGRLGAAGYVTSIAGKVAFTDAGRAIAGVVAPPRTSAELQARIMGSLSGPEQKLLRAVLGHYPLAISKLELAAETHYGNVRSGGFSEPLGRLTRLGLVWSPDKGLVMPADALFLPEDQR